MKDYYEILGMDKSADSGEIKTAFRSLAKKYHPDLNPGNAEAEKRFKEINESYEVLGNEKKRKQYDQMRAMGGRGFSGFNPFEGFGGFDFGNFTASAKSPSGQSQSTGRANFSNMGDLGDLFSSVFSGTSSFGGSKSSQSRPQPQKGEDIYVKLDVPFDIAAKGGKSTIRMHKTSQCEVCGGSGAAPGSSKTRCQQCKGRGKIQSQQGAFSVARPCPTCLGRGYIVQMPCSRCLGVGSYKRPRSLSVSIPVGVQSGQKIKLSGEGKPGDNGQPTGDLYIEVCVENHPDFKREGNNLISEHTINLKNALLGTKIPVKTINGEVELTIPPGIQPGTSLRIKGHGITSGPHQGDHLARIQVRLPNKLNSKQKTLLEEFARQGLD